MKIQKADLIIYNVLVSFIKKGEIFTAFDILKAAKKKTRSKFVDYSAVKQIINQECDDWFMQTYDYWSRKINIDLGADDVEEDLYFPLGIDIDKYIETKKEEVKEKMKNKAETKKSKKTAKELNDFMDKLDASKDNDDTCYNQHTLYGIPFVEQIKQNVVEKQAKEQFDDAKSVIKQKINEFVSKGKSFSGFDLTKDLKNNGHNISDKYVKEVLKSMFVNDEMNNYKRKYITNTNTCTRSFLYYLDKKVGFDKDRIEMWDNKKAKIEEKIDEQVLLNELAKFAEEELIGNPLKEAKTELINLILKPLDKTLSAIEAFLSKLRTKLNFKK